MKDRASTGLGSYPRLVRASRSVEPPSGHGLLARRSSAERSRVSEEPAALRGQACYLGPRFFAVLVGIQCTAMPDELIPPVAPEDIKRMHEFDRTHSRAGTDGRLWLQDRNAACSPGADISAVSSRCAMVGTMTRYNHGQLVAPWQQGKKLDDAVSG